jgi:predicted NodU family carbamoyl transferase
MTAILGISAFYHDSAAALVVDGKIIAAAQEERFTCKKHDPSYPVNTIFKDSVRTKNIAALTPYVIINDDYLIDPKFGGKYPLKNKLYVYESEDDLVREVSAKDVPELIKQQPIIVRHWVQLFKDTWVQNIIVWLSPRLVYLFE